MNKAKHYRLGRRFVEAQNRINNILNKTEITYDPMLNEITLTTPTEWPHLIDVERMTEQAKERLREIEPYEKHLLSAETIRQLHLPG